jgi:hypothetical protein
MNLFPSVTTITKILDSPGLKRYFRRQMWEATVTTARLDDEADDAYFDRCCQWADEHSELARNAGTAVHGAIERHIQGQTVEPEYAKHVNAVEIALEQISIPLLYGKAERSFAHADGYGGKIDVSGAGWVVDFKSKPELGDKTAKSFAYPEHVMQLAAYAHGLGIVAPRCVNVFVGVKDGKAVCHEWDAVEIARGLRTFQLCLALWKEVNQYSPCTVSARQTDNETILDNAQPLCNHVAREQ